MKKSIISIVIILIIFGALYIFSWKFHSSVNYAVKATIWKIKNCELKNHNEIIKESTRILIPHNDEEYELFLKTL